MRRLLLIAALMVFVLAGCSSEKTGIYTKEGFQLKKEVLCERWDLFISTDNLHFERDSIIQDLQSGFQDLAEITGEVKYVILLNAADHYALTKNLDDGIVGRIGSYCNDFRMGKD